MSEVAHAFVKEAFASVPDGARPVVAGFIGNPKDRNQVNWSANGVNGEWPEYLTEDCNLYVSLSSIYPDASGNYKNQSKNVAALHFLMVDDIGTGEGAKSDGKDIPEPSYKIQTSPDNFQYFYLLSEPITDRNYARKLCNALAEQAGGDPDASNNVRWARLPGGVNGKPDYLDINGNPVPTVATVEEPWVTFTADDIIGLFNLDLDGKPKAENFEPADEEVVREFEYKQPMDLSTEKIRRTLEYIKQDADPYKSWIDVGQALHHQFEGSEEGWQVWDEWSQNSPDYQSPVQTREKWATFGSNSITPGNILTFRSLFQRAKEIRKRLLAEKEKTKLPGLQAFTPRDLDLANIDLAPMNWLIGQRMLSKYVTATFAPGGVSKSTFSMVTAVAIAADRADITGETLKQGRVWILNNEDDEDILLKRLAAIAIRHGVDWSTVQENIRITSGYASPYKVDMTDEEGVHFNVDKIISEIKANNIRLLIVDPFISTHSQEENSNEAIQSVVDQFKRIAAETQCAIELIHHTRKGGSGANSEHYAGEADAGRGAGSLKDAARIVQTLAKMSDKSAEEYRIPPEEARRLVRLDMGKGNFSLPDAQVQWFRLDSVQLSNGDSMGVHELFDLEPHIEQAQRDKSAQKDAEVVLKRQVIFEEALKIGIDGDGVKLTALKDQLESRFQCSWATAKRYANQCFHFGENQALMLEDIDGNRYQVWYEKHGETSPVKLHFKEIRND